MCINLCDNIVCFWRKYNAIICHKIFELVYEVSVIPYKYKNQNTIFLQYLKFLRDHYYILMIFCLLKLKLLPQITL